MLFYRLLCIYFFLVLHYFTNNIIAIKNTSIKENDNTQEKKIPPVLNNLSKKKILLNNLMTRMKLKINPIMIFNYNVRNISGKNNKRSIKKSYDDFQVVKNILMTRTILKDTENPNPFNIQNILIMNSPKSYLKHLYTVTGNLNIEYSKSMNKNNKNIDFLEDFNQQLNKMHLLSTDFLKVKEQVIESTLKNNFNFPPEYTFDNQWNWNNYNFNLSLGIETQIFFNNNIIFSGYSAILWEKSTFLESKQKIFNNSIFPVGLQNAILFKMFLNNILAFHFGFINNIYFISKTHDLFQGLMKTSKSSQYPSSKNITYGIIFGGGLKMYKNIYLDLSLVIMNFYHILNFFHSLFKILFNYPLIGWTNKTTEYFHNELSTIGIQCKISFN